jgi:proteasome lid subunit RPN8/RPN11
LIHKIFPVPYEDCTIREELFLDWKTDSIQPILVEADKYGLSVLKIHSHPSGYADFSKTDDQSDLKLFESVFGWTLNVQNLTFSYTFALAPIYVNVPFD